MTHCTGEVLTERPWPSRLKEARAAAGYLLDTVSEVALMVSLHDPTFPVVGASLGYQEHTGYFIKDLFGRSLQEVLTAGAPEIAVSKSASKNAHDFCNRCKEAAIEDMSETAVVQPSTRKDGSQLTVLSLLGMVEVRRKPYVMILQESLGDGFLVRCTAVRRTEITENCRRAFWSLRGRLKRLAFQSSSSSSMGASDSEAESSCSSMRSRGRVSRREHGTALGHRRESVLVVSYGAMPRFAFFRERLQDHCMLSNCGRTASRREMTELQSGCLVFSDRPVQLDAGCLHFAMRVNQVTESFDGLPLLGFTRRVPRNDTGLMPQVPNCLGASVLVGTGGKAYARDKHDHYKMGFKPPPTHEVETWSLPQGESCPWKCKLSVGDTVGCIYTNKGRIQFWLNQEKILDFDTGRPIQDADYYAVADVCFTAGSLTLFPSEIVTREVVASKAKHPRGSLAAKASGNYMPASLLTDVQAPLSNIMSVDDLGTIDLNATHASSASSSMESLPSIGSNQTDPGTEFVDRASYAREHADIACFWESEVHTLDKTDEDAEQPAVGRLGDVQVDKHQPALEQKSTGAKLQAGGDFQASEEQSTIEAETLVRGRLSHHTDYSKEVVDQTQVSFKSNIFIGAVLCTLVIAFLGRSRQFGR